MFRLRWIIRIRKSVNLFSNRNMKSTVIVRESEERSMRVSETLCASLVVFAHYLTVIQTTYVVKSSHEADPPT